jgi:DNA replication and repair protein RecF
VNIFLGDNGEGKTNILEGISYLCLSKSFFAMSDAVVVKLGEQSFNIAGIIVGENGIEYEVRLQFDQIANKKTIEVNRERINKSLLLIGQFPIVILSPGQNAITIGSPINRRQWIDFIISQSSRVYLENLIDYRRVLKQRNRILSETRSTQNEISDAIEPWDKNLIHIGTIIMKKRIEFLSTFCDLVKSSYAQLAGTNEQPGIMYKPSFDCMNNDTKSIEEVFSKTLQNMFLYERRTGHSLVGPHRDEFVFTINKLNMQKYASQGQHKTFLIALKLAEFFYLKDKCKETPILLLDDVLSELDIQRSQRLLEATAKYGQIFITSTSDHELDWTTVSTAHPRRFLVRQGNIENVEDTACVN